MMARVLKYIVIFFILCTLVQPCFARPYGTLEERTFEIPAYEDEQPKDSSEIEIPDIDSSADSAINQPLYDRNEEAVDYQYVAAEFDITTKPPVKLYGARKQRFFWGFGKKKTTTTPPASTPPPTQPPTTKPPKRSILTKWRYWVGIVIAVIGVPLIILAIRSCFHPKTIAKQFLLHT